LNNSGSVTINSGTLKLNGGGANNGSMVLQGTSQLEFNSTYTLNAVSTLSSGTVRFSSGTVMVNGSYDVSGTTLVTGGTLTFGASATVVNWGNRVDLSNATVNLNLGKGVILPNLLLSNTTLSSSDPLTVTGVMTWSGGTLSGSG